jgi:hypothetical protein
MALDGRGASFPGRVVGEAGCVTQSRTPAVGVDEATRVEEAIDDVLAESFPASDAPPWTLGVDACSAYFARPVMPAETEGCDDPSGSAGS